MNKIEKLQALRAEILALEHEIDRKVHLLAEKEGQRKELLTYNYGENI